LGTSIEVKKFFNTGIKRLPKEEKIAETVIKEKLLAEISFIKEHFTLFNSVNFSVICSPSDKMPTIMSEIGRLREVTFRAVGEGTNKSNDIDEFDLYYNQMFIWDNDEHCIVGAYRLGKGKEIMQRYNIGGFYSQSLFRMKQSFAPVLNQSVELGRSFIVQEYQRKPLPLFLLWKGILYFLIKHTEYRYLIGPVSISNNFSEFSKGVIVEFIRKYCYHYAFAKYIVPRKEFRVPNLKIDTDILIESFTDVNKLDKLIEEVELKNGKMPVLLKKYIKLNGKIMGFNIDPKFNNCIDGLMILDLFDVPRETINSLSKEIKDESLLDRFINL